MSMEYTASRTVLGFLQGGRLRGEDYENADADIFFPKKGYRKATVNASTANRKLHYIEEAIRRAGNVPLADALAEIRCIHIFRLTELFIGEPEEGRACLETEFQDRWCQIPAPVDTENEL